MLHAGPTLLFCSLNHRFHIVYLRKAFRDITHQCGICRRQTAKPQPQLRGQLLLERVTPGSVFEKVGVDYAGPLKVKYGMVRKTHIVRAYVCVFVSLAVKAVHLEVVSDLTMEAFVAALQWFIARRGYPSLIWSDHGTNFVSANRELKDLCQFRRRRERSPSFVPPETLSGSLFRSKDPTSVVFGRPLSRAQRSISGALWEV